MAVCHRLAVELRHQHALESWHCWQTARNYDALLVLGGSSVDLFDGEFFAGVLSIEPSFCETAEFEAGLNVEPTLADKCGDLGEELFGVA
jgi:hypothetical protein